MLKRLLPILLLAALVLSVPHLVRLKYFSNHLMGTAPYYHAQAAELLPTRIDPLTGKDIEVNAYHYILSFLGGKIGFLTASNLLPFLCGIICVVLFWLILKKHGFEHTTLALVLLITSPLFSYGFTVSSPFNMVIILNLAGYLFLLRGSLWSALFFSMVPLFGANHAVVTALLLIAHAIQNKSMRKEGITLGLMLASTLIFADFSTLPIKESGNFIELNLASFGAALGFNAFSLILSFIGLVYFWNHKKRASYVMLIVLIIASFALDNQYKMLINLILSAFAAMGLMSIIQLKWELELVRKLTILIVIVGLAFSSINYLSRLSFMEPDAATLQTLYWIGDNARLETKVLSSPYNGYWIRYLSERESVIDARSSEHELQLAMEAFTTRDEATAREYLDSNNITYIMVDEKTRDLMKLDNRMGLLFIMENSPDFQMIAQYGDKSIWEYSKMA
jgi:hypothetical protein